MIFAWIRNRFNAVGDDPDRIDAHDALEISVKQREEESAKRRDAERQADRMIELRTINHFGEAWDRAFRERNPK